MVALATKPASRRSPFLAGASLMCDRVGDVVHTHALVLAPYQTLLGPPSIVYYRYTFEHISLYSRPPI
jgi:hypothetical protein